MLPMIRCYHAGAPVPENSFFVLSKSRNAGRPGFQPWTNSFIVVCPHKQYHDFFFMLIYALFQAGKFKSRHRGSKIQFINLNDVRDLLHEVARSYIQTGKVLGYSCIIECSAAADSHFSGTDHLHCKSAASFVAGVF
jgi:hypothetical protein